MTASPQLRLLFEGETSYEGDGAMVETGGTRMWGRGVGVVRGPQISGSMSWCNHARRDDAGAWHPDAHGVITTDDGAAILIDFEGHSVPGEGDAVRLLTCAARFQTDASTYAWLNHTVAVLLGEFTPSTGATKISVHAVTTG